MVIGLSGMLGTGKSVAARIMVEEFGFTLLKFADPLKDMLRAIGITEREIEGDLKEVPSEKLMGKTPRYAMQTLGTEWGRNTIDPNFWVNLWADRVLALPEGRHVVSDDCRFIQEWEMIKKCGGEIWRIERPGLDFVDMHESEVGQLRLGYDGLIRNTGTLESFKQSIRVKLVPYLV